MGQERTVKPHQGLRCTALVLLLTSGCVETGNRREELKPFDDGHYCMDLAHDCSLCGGKTLDSPCDSCFKYKALCK